MLSAFLISIGLLILGACIAIIVLLYKNGQKPRSKYDIGEVYGFIEESVHAALRRQNEELARQYGEIFREAERIDNMLSDDEIDIASITEATSARVLAMLVGRLEDEHIGLTSDIRKVSQKISLANAHLASHLAGNFSALALDDQKNIRELEVQKEHLEERQVAVRKKLDDLRQAAESLPSKDVKSGDTQEPKYRYGITTERTTIGD